MSWKDRLLPASFRGVPFSIERHTFASGRRLQHDTFSGLDLHVYTDHGRAERVFDLSGFLFGPDCDVARNRLIAALEEPGFGKLDHPHLGEILAFVREFRVDERRTAQEYVEFTATFTELSFTLGAVETEATIRTDATAEREAVNVAAEARMAEDLEIEQVPDTVTKSIDQHLRDLGNIIRSANVLDGPIRQVATVTAAVDNLIVGGTTLLHAPLDLAAEVTRAVSTVFGATSRIQGALRAYRDLSRFRALLVREWGPATRAINRNAITLANAVRMMALGGWVDAAVQTTWGSLDEAIDYRDTILEELDALQAESTEDLDELEALHRAAVEGIPQDPRQLPRVGSFTPRASTTTLQLAYRLHDDVSLATDIRDRNRLSRPGRIQAGRPLEVLVDA